MEHLGHPEEEDGGRQEGAHPEAAAHVAELRALRFVQPNDRRFERHPHFGHAPGRSLRTSGSMGQT
jgi:hypothetical protein